jgi:diadenosine tetraphosphatase ApaH/serine/threonine PP2A family protein phosphatase
MIRCYQLYASLAALFAFAACGGAQAQTSVDNGQGSAFVGGQAPPVCRISAPRTVFAQNAVFQAGSESSGQVTISQLVDPVSGVARASRIALDFPAVCNHTHVLVVRSLQGGLKRVEGASGAGFSSRVDYNLSARWAGGDRTTNLSGQPRALTISVLEGAAGTIELNLEAPGGGQSLVAGNYQDQVVVEFTAAS